MCYSYVFKSVPRQQRKHLHESQNRKQGSQVDELCEIRFQYRTHEDYLEDDKMEESIVQILKYFVK